MTLIKLTYSHPTDQFITVTVLGDPKGIFDLYFRLKQANPEYSSHGFSNIKLSNLDGHPIDASVGIGEAICNTTQLSKNVE
jgi:hypothetical protein